MSGPAYKLDIALLGGGIAGLWLLNHLSTRGFRCALFSTPAVGGQQTLASQGMIHAGTKYALGERPGREPQNQATGRREAARVLATMPALWEDCMNGVGTVDLRQTRRLSPHLWLWARGGFTGPAQMLIASRMYHGHMESVAWGNWPDPFTAPRFRGELYRLDEPVLDSKSLVGNLCANFHDHIFGIEQSRLRISMDKGQQGVLLNTGHDTIAARQLLLCAGAGNEALLQQLGARQPAMQRRPLRQVMLSHPSLPPLYGHWLDASRLPRITVSSHPVENGQWLWYLGGKLAEEAATLSDEDSIKLARRELRTLFPQLAIEGARWGSVLVDRAEPQQAEGGRPAGTFCEFLPLSPLQENSPILVAWPTKLSLAPALAAQVESMLGRPAGEQAPGQWLPDPRHYPWKIAALPWEGPSWVQACE